MKDLTLRVNGKDQIVSQPCDVLHLLQELGLSPERVLVELNQVVLFRRDYETTLLKHLDRLEIMEVAAGG